MMPRQESQAAHYHLLLDQQTGLHHANLKPEFFGAHEHHAHQLTIPFNQAKGSCPGTQPPHDTRSNRSK